MEEIRAELDAVHAELRALAESLSPDDLFEPRRYAWTDKWSLSAFVGGCTYHHYSWAQTQIRAWLKRKEKRSAPRDDVQP